MSASVSVVSKVFKLPGLRTFLLPNSVISGSCFLFTVHGVITVSVESFYTHFTRISPYT
jgi:hypothetical protein